MINLDSSQGIYVMINSNAYIYLQINNYNLFCQYFLDTAFNSSFQFQDVYLPTVS